MPDAFINRHKRRDHAKLRQRLINATGQTLTCVALGLFVAFITINWLTGCGEQFPTDAVGNYIQGECIYPTDLWK